MDSETGESTCPPAPSSVTETASQPDADLKQPPRSRSCTASITPSVRDGS